MSRPAVTGGGRLRDRVGTRNPAPAFGLLGVVLVAAGVAVPAYETLLVVWGGTALFVALLLRFVVTGETLAAAVTTDVYETMATNARRLGADGPVRYVPGEDGVSLVAGDVALDPVGARLLGPADETPAAAPSGAESGAEETPVVHLSVLVDVVVSDLELAARVSATPTDDGATVTVTDSRVGTGELFDHPVVSVVGVGLARRLGTPVAVDATAEGEELTVTCRWDSQRGEELLDGAETDQHGEHEAAAE